MRDIMEKWIRKDKIWEYQNKGFHYMIDPAGDRVKRGESFLMRMEPPKPIEKVEEAPKPIEKVEKKTAPKKKGKG